MNIVYCNFVGMTYMNVNCPVDQIMYRLNLFATRSRAVSTALNQKFTALVYANLRPLASGKIWPSQELNPLSIVLTMADHVAKQRHTLWLVDTIVYCSQRTYSAVDQVWGRGTRDEGRGTRVPRHLGTWTDHHKPPRSRLSTVNQKLSDIHYIRGTHWNNIWIRPIYTAYGPT